LRENALRTFQKDTEGDFCVLKPSQPSQCPIIKGFMRFYEPSQKVSVTVLKSEESPMKSRVVTHVTFLKEGNGGKQF
jgi:hypothetical protein